MWLCLRKVEVVTSVKPKKNSLNSLTRAAKVAASSLVTRLARTSSVASEAAIAMRSEPGE